MKRLNNTFNCLFLFAIILAFYACSRQKGAKDIIVQAENIVEQQPDSALRLLNTVLFPEDLDKSGFNKYNLLLLQAKDKSYKDITSDTVIFAVKNYYLKKKDYPNAALAAFYCGRVLQDQKKPKEAIKEFLEVDDYGEKIENTNLMGLSQSHIGEILSMELFYIEAIEHFKMAIQYFREAKNIKNEIISYNLIGNAYLKNSFNDSAFYYYNKGLKLATVNKDSLQIAKITQCIGVAYRETGKYNQADECFRNADGYTHNGGDKLILYLNISKTFYGRGMMDSAKIYVNKSLSMMTNNTDIFVKTNIYKTLSQISETQTDFKQSLEYYKEYSDNLKKIVNENSNKEALEIQKRYNYERFRNENNQMRIRNQKIYISFLIAFFILGFIAIFLYKKTDDSKKLALQKENQILDAEKKIYQLMEMSNSYNSKEISLKNALLRHFDILKKVVSLKQTTRSDDIKSYSLVRKFNEIVYGQESMNWTLFYQDMNSIHNGLFNILKNQHPELTETEFRICCLTYADFTCSEIGIIMGLSANTVHMKRSAIRKKLSIESQGNIQNYLNTLVDNGRSSINKKFIDTLYQ